MPYKQLGRYKLNGFLRILFKLSSYDGQIGYWFLIISRVWDIDTSCAVGSTFTIIFSTDKAIV